MLNGGTGVDDGADPLRFHPLQQFLPVCIKLFIVIMRVCIKNHTLISCPHVFAPPGLSPVQQKREAAGLLFFCRSIISHFIPTGEKFQRFSVSALLIADLSSYNTISSTFSNPSIV